MIQANDKVTYFGEEFKVVKVFKDSAFIVNAKHGYGVPLSTLTFVEHCESAAAPKKKSRK